MRASDTRRTIFQEILDSSLPLEEKSHQRLADEAQVVVGGGVETAAYALSVTSYHIANNPQIYEKLHNELVKAFPNPSVIGDMHEYEKLPYLKACVYEGLRLSYGFVGRSPRQFDKDLRYGEWTIPASAIITMTVIDVCHDEAIFPDSHSFIPERWLNEPRTHDGFSLEHYLVVFSKGPRICLGIK